MITPSAKALPKKRYTYSSAKLDVIFPDRIPVIHCIKRRHLINSHRRHLQDPRHLVHHTQRCKTSLSLSQVKQWHDGGLLVLRWVARQNLFDDGLVLGGELEGDRGVVFGGVAVLGRELAIVLHETMWYLDGNWKLVA